MSDTTATPADVAAKVDQQPAQANDQTRTAPNEPKADETDWKAEARKWEQRAKENKTAAEEASKTEAEKVADRLAEFEKRTADAESRAMRRDVAIEFHLTKEDASLLDAITDEDAMRSLAQRLAGESDKKRNHVPREGNPPTATGDDRRDFLRRLTGRE